MSDHRPADAAKLAAQWPKTVERVTERLTTLAKQGPTGDLEVRRAEVRTRTTTAPDPVAATVSTWETAVEQHVQRLAGWLDDHGDHDGIIHRALIVADRLGAPFDPDLAAELIDRLRGTPPSAVKAFTGLMDDVRRWLNQLGLAIGHGWQTVWEGRWVLDDRGTSVLDEQTDSEARFALSLWWSVHRELDGLARRLDPAPAWNVRPGRQCVTCGRPMGEPRRECGTCRSRRSRARKAS